MTDELLYRITYTYVLSVLSCPWQMGNVELQRFQILKHGKLLLTRQ
jgi:hypothetical protein